MNTSFLKFSNAVTRGIIDDEYYRLKKDFIENNCKDCPGSGDYGICDCILIERAYKLEQG